MALILSNVLVLLAQLNAPGNDPTTPMPPADEGISCQLHDHKLVEMNRLCYYRCGEEEVEVTLPQSQQCPEEIQR